MDTYTVIPDGSGGFIVMVRSPAGGVIPTAESDDSPVNSVNRLGSGLLCAVIVKAEESDDSSGSDHAA